MRGRREGPIVALKHALERTRTLSDTATLIAGILLTSVGLLALLPYVLKQGWRQRSGDLAVDSGFASVMAAVDAFGSSPEEARPQASVAAEDLEELLAHLFSLRMTVSDATAELQEARENFGEAPDGAGEPQEAAEAAADAA
jgi:hypothetical protein